MSKIKAANPQISVHLYKTISRKTVDGKVAASARYQGKDEFIDLTPFLGDGSSVRTSKSVREPAGAFSITVTDKPQSSLTGSIASGGASAVESLAGLVEPMDVVEIRMWSGLGPKPDKLPIIMRGFVSEIHRSQAMGEGGQPSRQVVITGQDYGKIWQTFQVIYLAAYAEGKALLTTFGLFEMFKMEAKSVMTSAEFVREMIEKIVNPHIKGFMPENSTMPKEIQTGDSVSVKYGKVNNSYQQMQGSIYEIMRFHGDVGVWNELYTEDREDGVHCVYRAVPALKLDPPGGDAKSRLIQDDAPEPVYVEIEDADVQSISSARSDSNVANFYWVTNSRFDLVDEMFRKLSAIPADDGRVSTKEYPNTDVKYYGTRPMYAETQQGDTAIEYMGSGLDDAGQEQRRVKMEEWIDRRRRLMLEMNQDNVVFERGNARVKGGPIRPDGEAMKAGDYVRFKMGRMPWDAYVVQVDHEFMPFHGYFTTLTYERGEGFAVRMTQGGGMESPWLAEQALRGGAK